MGRTRVLYREYDPNAEGVSHIAVAIVDGSSYVWCVYSLRNNKELLKLLEGVLSNVVEMPKDIAFKLFEFFSE